MENHMSTKLLFPAALALAVGLSSWSAGAATPDTDGAPVVKTAGVLTRDIDAARSTNGTSEAATHVSEPSGESAPNARERLFSSPPFVRTGVRPGIIFQLRDSAGG